jgi:nucleotide-binding universal stress UspA family protein
MYRKILVPLDIHQEAECQYMMEVIRQLFSHQGNPHIHLLTVLPHDEELGALNQFIPEDFADQLHEKACETLDALASDLQKSNLLCSTDVLSGNVYVETLAVAEKLNANLIIIGASRPELKDYFLGPSAARVVRHADCSVLVVREKDV